ncbi:hypothetical protein FRC03_007267, partial [Tulasnella sp. 419]
QIVCISAGATITITSIPFSFVPSPRHCNCVGIPLYDFLLSFPSSLVKYGLLTQGDFGCRRCNLVSTWLSKLACRLSKGAGISGIGTVPQVLPSTHFTTIINLLPHQILRRPLDNTIASLFLQLLVIVPLSVLVQKQKKRLIFVLFVSKLLLQQRGPLSFAINAWLIIFHKHGRLFQVSPYCTDSTHSSSIPLQEWDVVVG